MRYIVEKDMALWQAASDGTSAMAAPYMFFADWLCGVGGSSLGIQPAGGVPIEAIETQK